MRLSACMRGLAAVRLLRDRLFLLGRITICLHCTAPQTKAMGGAGA